MSASQRMRQPPAPVDEDPDGVIGRLVKSVEALTSSINDPNDGLKARTKTIEMRVGQVEGKMDIVTNAFRLGPDHKGGESRSVVGMTPLQIAFGVVGMLGSTVGVITLIQIFAPAIAAFSHVLAHGVMTHATPAG